MYKLFENDESEDELTHSKDKCVSTVLDYDISEESYYMREMICQMKQLVRYLKLNVN